MSEYVPTIGLEIHAELRTATKMFCSSRNDPFAAEPNAHICPVCMAHPGTLPVINREAVRKVLLVGIALGAKLADYTEFDRKNYFYPDLPKGYQISQYEYPLVAGGELAGVAITRVHLEEDTASSVHDEATGATLIDYNRAGVPLMELVTEPVMHSAEEAGRFARELQLLLRYLGVSGANMERGEMRVEANVSVAKEGERSSAYVEIKNLNSFRAMERAVAYEIGRQTKLLEEGRELRKETLGWDESRQATFPQRSKEGSADYRYFPDPDLPSLRISTFPEFEESALRTRLPELPTARRARYLALGIKPDDADLYVRETAFGDFYDAVLEYVPESSRLTASNFIANDLVSLVRASRDAQGRESETQDEIRMKPESYAQLVSLFAERKLSSRSAKDVLAALYAGAEDPSAYAAEHDLLQKAGGALEPVVDAVIADNPNVVADLRAGKAAALEYLLGQCMRQLRGAGDPEQLRALLRKKLS